MCKHFIRHFIRYTKALIRGVVVMEVMFGYIIGGWAIGMAGYIYFTKKNKYNNITYLNLKDKAKKYKRMREDVNSKNTGLFK
jgi:hypothetical protein